MFLFRLGGFQPTDRERQGWFAIGATLVAWVVLLAIVGPLPPSLSLLLSGGVIVLAIGSWRSGRYRLEEVPAESRDEVARRREWMRAHAGLIVALGTGLTILISTWALAIAILAGPG